MLPSALCFLQVVQPFLPDFDYEDGAADKVGGGGQDRAGQGREASPSLLFGSPFAAVESPLTVEGLRAAGEGGREGGWQAEQKEPEGGQRPPLTHPPTRA